MKSYFIHRLTGAALVGVAAGMTATLAAEAQSGSIDETITNNGVTPKLELTPAQRSAIYREVRRDKSKNAPSRFATNAGAQVPPMIELYILPDEVIADNPEAKLYKYARVDDQLVLVDPTNMRVVAVIGPRSTQ